MVNDTAKDLEIISNTLATIYQAVHNSDHLDLRREYNETLRKLVKLSDTLLDNMPKHTTLLK